MKTSSIILILTLSLSFVLTSCLQDPEEVVIETIIEICEDEQKLADLKALFNPFHNAIYITPDYQDRAIERLALVPVAGTTDELFEYQAFTLLGEPVPAWVKLEVADLETLQDMSVAVEAELQVIAEEEFLAAEQLASSETYTGYECKSVDVARTTRCHVFPGYSTNTEKYERFLCRRGDIEDECTEWTKTIGWSYRYNNQDCSGSPSSADPIFALACP